MVLHSCPYRAPSWGPYRALGSPRTVGRFGCHRRAAPAGLADRRGWLWLWLWLGFGSASSVDFLIWLLPFTRLSA